MTDKAKPLVERLRNKAKWLEPEVDMVEEWEALEAADLIETQAREIERLRGLVSSYRLQIDRLYDRAALGESHD